jgi:hypothetical protein
MLGDGASAPASHSEPKNQTTCRLERMKKLPCIRLGQCLKWSLGCPGLLGSEKDYTAYFTSKTKQNSPFFYIKKK